MRALLTGWFSFRHGEATAGDVLALDAVRLALDDAGLEYDVAWSPVFRPGALTLAAAPPERYTHLVFICGPATGAPVAGLHERYAACRRIAVGVTVIDRAGPGYRGFDRVLARDGDRGPPARDLAAALAWPPSPPRVPVTGVVLATGQGEYGARRRHEAVNERLTQWVGQQDCAPIPLETRLDTTDWRLCSTADAFGALLSRLDVVVTTRLHGLVLALRAGIPALAVDPVAGGGKVTAQARAWSWPAILAAESTRDRARLDAQWDWCLSAAGRAAATAAAAGSGPAHQPALLTELVADLRADSGGRTAG